MSQPPGPPPPAPPSMPSAPVYFPPPAFYPPARSGGGFARTIFTALAVSVLGFSITLNVYLLIASGVLSSNPIKQTVVRDGDAKSVVALVPINGVITDQTVAEVNQTLGEIESDSAVKAVVLEINSPGGAVTASDEIYDRIQRLKKAHGWPVVVSMGALSTSGGYYISCAADAIVAQRTTWTGNIGVLLPRYNVSKLAQAYGVEDDTIKSTGSDFKDAGSPLKADTPEQRAYFQKLADDAFGTFKQVVGSGRSLDAKTVAALANGKVYSGPDALGLKLVDQIGYLEDAIDLAAGKAGLGGGKPKAVRFEHNAGLFESLSGRSSMQTKTLGAKVGGVDISIDKSVIDDLLAPRPMYLWRGE